MSCNEPNHLISQIQMYLFPSQYDLSMPQIDLSIMDLTVYV